MYSAIKKIDHRKPEYSVMNPATSSLSASGRSKGARFVPAVAQVIVDPEREERETDRGTCTSW